MNDLPENEILARAQAGDTDAEDEVVRRYEPMSRAFAARYSRFGNEPEVLQAARIGTLEAARKYRPEGARFSSVAFNTARARAFREARSYDSVVRTPESAGRTADAELPHDLEAETTPEREFEIADLRARVKAKIARARLPALEQAIFEQRLLPLRPEFSRAEIALRFGVSKTCVREREARLRMVILPRVLRELRPTP